MSLTKIGNVKIETPLALAPLLGVNCTTFRLLCKKKGAGLIYSGMFDSDEIIRKNKCEKFLAEESPLAIQIVGNNKEKLEQATQIVDEYANIIDINLSCPMKEILAKKSEAFFLKHPEQLKKIIKPVMNNTNKPITAKIRTGWDSQNINCVEVCKQLEDYGISAVAIHGRTTKQRYSGKADWEIIKQVKEKTNLTIIGNGDITKPGQAKYYLERNYCDIVMIGRGAMGNPDIFRRCKHLLETGTNTLELTEQEKKLELIDFLKLYEQTEDKMRIGEIKDHINWFLKSNRNKINILNKIKNMIEIEQIIDVIANN